MDAGSHQWKMGYFLGFVGKSRTGRSRFNRIRGQVEAQNQVQQAEFLGKGQTSHGEVPTYPTGLQKHWRCRKRYEILWKIQ